MRGALNKIFEYVTKGLNGKETGKLNFKMFVCMKKSETISFFLK